MDTKSIGQFLAKMRKEHNMTQEQLGEKIGVTNKTISRWETGAYMPPVDILVKLSEIYGITINEILSGRKVNASEYKQVAEKNIKSVLSESAFSQKEKINFFQKKWKKDHAFEMTIQMFFIIAIICFGIFKNDGILLIGIILGFVWSIKKYNQMMGYVEKNAFDGTGCKD